MLAIERKRTERSKEPFLLDAAGRRKSSRAGDERTVLEAMANSLLASSRETDIVVGTKRARSSGDVHGTGRQRQELHSEHDPEQGEVNVPGRFDLQEIQPSEHLVSTSFLTTGIMATPDARATRLSILT